MLGKQFKLDLQAIYYIGGKHPRMVNWWKLPKKLWFSTHPHYDIHVYIIIYIHTYIYIYIHIYISLYITMNDPNKSNPGAFRGSRLQPIKTTSHVLHVLCPLEAIGNGHRPSKIRMKPTSVEMQPMIRVFMSFQQLISTHRGMVKNWKTTAELQRALDIDPDQSLLHHQGTPNTNKNTQCR